MDYKTLAPYLQDLRADLRREMQRQEEVNARVAYLTRAIEGIEGLLGPEAPPGPEIPGMTGASEDGDAPIIGTPAIRVIMQENPHPWRPKEIYKLLAQRGWLSANARDPRRGVEAALNRMWRSGEIERISPGRYQYKTKEESTTGSQ